MLVERAGQRSVSMRAGGGAQVAAMDRVMAECEGMLANARQQERAAAADRAAAAAERAGAARAAAGALKGAGARRSLPGNALKARLRTRQPGRMLPRKPRPLSPAISVCTPAQAGVLCSRSGCCDFTRR